MSEHTKEPWVVHLFEGGAFVINVSVDADMSPVICSRYINWSHRGRESHDNAIRIGQCVNALAGLTPEQVTAVPRLVAWYRGTPASFAKHEDWMAEWRELDRIYKEIP